MTQIKTARKLTKNEMQAIQGGVDTPPPPPPPPPPCDNNPRRGYTTTEDGTIEQCPTAAPVAKCFPTKPAPQY